MRRRNSIFAYADNATKYLAGIPRNALFVKRLSASDTMSRLANGRRVGCRVAFGLKSQSQSPWGVLFRNSNRRVLIRRVDTGATGNSCEANNPFLSCNVCFVTAARTLQCRLLSRRDPANEFQHTNAICGNCIFFAQMKRSSEK